MDSKAASCVSDSDYISGKTCVNLQKFSDEEATWRHFPGPTMIIICAARLGQRMCKMPNMKGSYMRVHHLQSESFIGHESPSTS